MKCEFKGMPFGKEVLGGIIYIQFLLWVPLMMWLFTEPRTTGVEVQCVQICLPGLAGACRGTNGALRALAVIMRMLWSSHCVSTQMKSNSGVGKRFYPQRQLSILLSQKDGKYSSQSMVPVEIYKETLGFHESWGSMNHGCVDSICFHRTCFALTS